VQLTAFRGHGFDEIGVLIFSENDVDLDLAVLANRSVHFKQTPRPAQVRRVAPRLEHGENTANRLHSWTKLGCKLLRRGHLLPDAI
jgi:hypothetical protein